VSLSRRCPVLTTFYVILTTLFFESAADLPSYAVIDFCGPGRVNAEHLIGVELFNSMGGHGMRLLNQGRDRLRELIVRDQGPRKCPDADSVLQCFNMAKAAARKVFLGDGYFFGPGVGVDGHIEETWFVEDKGKWHRIPPHPEPTHEISNATVRRSLVSSLLYY
jgi:hypothetical protein